MRLFWIAFGIGTHVLFAFTVFRLVPFLQGEGWAPGLFSRRAALHAGWLWPDALLALQFAVVHSYFLLPSTRDKLSRWIPSPHYGCCFCVITCVSLLTTIECWQTAPTAWWRLHGPARTIISTGFVLSWASLFYSLHLTGLGYQTGWTPWWAWVRSRPAPRRTFEPRGAYRLLRHPIYLSFLGLVWLTPTVTLDRALLIVLWTAYIFVGSYLKDRRLVHYVGEPYRRFQARVPGYPFIPFGPLARVRLLPTPTLAAPANAPRSCLRISSPAPHHLR